MEPVSGAPSSGTGRWRGPGSRQGGFTLIEVLVVVTLLLVVAALVAPALPTPAATQGELQGVVDSARRLALQRAESLTLSVGPGGRWALEGRSGGGEPVASGAVEMAGASSFVLHVSPLGACLLDRRGRSPEDPLRVDPVRCRLATGETAP